MIIYKRNAIGAYHPITKAIEIELALLTYFRYLNQTVITNISYSFIPQREIDVLVVSKSNYATECEIKVSKGDLVRDKDKIHGHISDKIKYLYFAIPKSLTPHVEYIPRQAGILVVDYVPPYEDPYFRGTIHPESYKVDVLREAKENTSARKLTDEEHIDILRLASKRIKTLKAKILKLQELLESVKPQGEAKE